VVVVVAVVVVVVAIVVVVVEDVVGVLQMSVRALATVPADVFPAASAAYTV